MLLPLLFVTSVSAQQLKGKIVDKDGIGIPFSSVILINKADSAFVAGAITKENGDFELTITSTPSFEQCLLQIRSIGYKSIYTDPRDELGEIVLQEDLQTLDEVVVSVERPKFTLENGKISVGVEHTVLENLGNATLTIAHLPFVSQTNEALTVFGRGTPLVYIDNRQVHGIEELTQLSSNEIKNIELILNPGVEYGSDVKSIIKVTTKRKGEGLSVNISTLGSVNKHLGSTHYAKLNYRYKKWDFFADASISKQHREDTQSQDIIFKDSSEIDLLQEQNSIVKNRTINSSVGFNYSDSPLQDFGIKYYFENTPLGINDLNGMSKYSENGIQLVPINVALQTKYTKTKHRINSYYNRTIGEEGNLRIDFDYLRGDNNTKYTAKQEDIDNINTNTRTKYHLYSGKAELDFPLWKGEMKIGTDFSQTMNNENYNLVEGTNSSITESEDESQQLLWSAFVSQDLNFEDIYIEFGGRFELTDYKYYHMLQLDKESSKTYSRIIPFFQFNYDKDDISTSISYTNSFNRPSYALLNNSIQYIDSYTYQSGNAKLKSSYEDVLNFLFSWKDIALDITHTWYYDKILYTRTLMTGENVVLFTAENIPYFREWAIDLSYAPTIGIWRPSFDAGVFKQNLVYNNITYNKPYYTYGVNNIFQISENINASLDMWGTSRGNLYLNTFEPHFRLDASINAHFFNRRLFVWLNVSDILGIDKEEWNSNVNNIYIAKEKRLDSQGVMLQLRYYFNPQSNKYKGHSTSSEINRL